MEKKNLRTGVVVSLHLLVWVLLGFGLLFYQPLSWGVRLPAVFWAKQLMNFFLLAGLFYFNGLVLVPRLLLKNKVLFYILSLVGAVAVVLLVSKTFDIQMQVSRQMDAVMPHPAPRPRGRLDGPLLMTSLLVLGISTSLAVVQRWQRDARERDTVEKQNISSELAFLKAQINPHFFFNTLNNIYALTFTDVPVSRDAILKLSRMMRYLLYETQQDTALLSQEISFVKDYIELMRLRIQGSTSIVFKEPSPDKEYQIAPMLLLPFVENAFKHGVSVMQKSSIGIDLAVRQNKLSLEVDNHIFRDREGVDMQGGGIGLANTQRRLDLLYPEKHSLHIEENVSENFYRVKLEIDLV